MQREDGLGRGDGGVWMHMMSWREGAGRAARSHGQLGADLCSTCSHNHTGQQGVRVC